ncbi:MAG: S-layer homology domain-containing protein [Clostridia bacterium]|nr:S-layer homology domain-containing protein [Clostridia bacterium]
MNIILPSRMNIFIKLSVVSLITALVLLLVPRAACAQEPYALTSSWEYTLIHEATVTADDRDGAGNIRVTLPLVSENLPVYQKVIGEFFSPWPDRIELDQEGNRMAVYRIDSLKNGEKAVLKQSYLISCSAIAYSLLADKFSPQSEYEVDDRYLQPDKFIESEHIEIVSYAKEIADGETNPYKLARKVFAEINLFMTYDTDAKYANRGALSARRTGRGVCEDYATLFVAIMRALGVPARMQEGYLYLPQEHVSPPYIIPDQQLVNLLMMRHAWPEFYLPGVGWVMADPTFEAYFEIGGVQEKIVDWSYFANIPSSRRYLFVGERAGDGTCISHSSTGHIAVEFSAYLALGQQYQPFNDIIGTWAEKSVLQLYHRGLIAGIGNGNFGGKLPLTRAQLAVILDRYFNTENKNSDFSDVPASYWAAGEIGAAQAAGWLNGYPDGSFRPNKVLSRAELAAVLCAAFELKLGQQQVSFDDLSKSGWAWADKSIIILASNGLASGKSPGIFAPADDVSRFELAAFLSSLINFYEK